jgi:hypothetical protein
MLLIHKSFIAANMMVTATIPCNEAETDLPFDYLLDRIPLEMSSKISTQTKWLTNYKSKSNCL